jgi:hypothetical protein
LFVALQAVDSASCVCLLVVLHACFCTLCLFACRSACLLSHDVIVLAVGLQSLLLACSLCLLVEPLAMLLHGFNEQDWPKRLGQGSGVCDTVYAEAGALPA